MVRRYRVSKTYSLDLLFYPSFALPLISIHDKGFKAVKDHGICKGLVIRVLSEDMYEVSHDNLYCVDYARFLLGLWFDPSEHVNRASHTFREIVDKLGRLFSSYGIAVSPQDDIWIFISIFLSQNTDYHRNTVPWVRRLLQAYNNPESIISEPMEKLFSLVGNNYQIKRLPEALKCYIEVRDRILKTRDARELLNCKWIGPKTYYAYRLHVLLDIESAPIDINLRRYLAGELRLKDLRPPDKRFCSKYSCNECYLRNQCIEYFLRENLRELTGWFQTVVYIYRDLAN